MALNNSQRLEKLHNALTEDLIKKIEDGTATSQELGVAAKLLKDNNITCVPVEGSKVKALEDALPDNLNNTVIELKRNFG